MQTKHTTQSVYEYACLSHFQSALRLAKAPEKRNLVLGMDFSPLQNTRNPKPSGPRDIQPDGGDSS